MTALDLEHMRSWIGRSESYEERIPVVSIHGMRALFDRADAPKEGDPLEPMEQRTLFTARAPQSQIGADGHPKRGDFMPPVPLPRRMAAGNTATFFAPLRVGEMARKVSSIHDVTMKEGRTGVLVFCTVRHHFINEAGTLCIEEDQNLVYRDNPPADAKDSRGNSGKTPPAPTDHAWIKQHHPDPVMLFRYSAVTFNGHRIHYDRRYAMEEEGYPGLVVHGPLTATLMLHAAMAANPGRKVQRFEYTARSPVFDIAPFHVAGKPVEDGAAADVWSVTPEGNLGTIGKIVWG
ncbi:MAG: MaoC family dehydratase N-terminal domain-containing protein [Alphaproteobacteria bacterium]